MKFSHKTIVKSTGLLKMAYTVRELSEELGIPNRTLRDWIVNGVPHFRDSRNHIFVIGTEFSKWVEDNKKKKASGRKLKNDEAYCFSCRRPVKLIDPIEKHITGKLINIKGKCDTCKNLINRGGRNEKFN